jgi:hypothetical protein
MWLWRQWFANASGYNSGIGPHAGGFSTINRALPPAVKQVAKLLFLKVTLGSQSVFQRRRNRFA